MCDSSQLGFNYEFIRVDCDVNEFCRSNVCLCLPNSIWVNGINMILMNKLIDIEVHMKINILMRSWYQYYRTGICNKDISHRNELIVH
jgi:hypothetical protein